VWTWPNRSGILFSSFIVLPRFLTFDVGFFPNWISNRSPKKLSNAHISYLLTSFYLDPSPLYFYTTPSNGSWGYTHTRVRAQFESSFPVCSFFFFFLPNPLQPLPPRPVFSLVCPFSLPGQTHCGKLPIPPSPSLPYFPFRLFIVLPDARKTAMMCQIVLIRLLPGPPTFWLC